MSPTDDEIRQAYRALRDHIAAVLFQHDPIGVNYEENTDEYNAEARRIAAQLKGCSSEADAQSAIFQVFEHSFGTGTAGTMDRYQAIASEIWQLWQKFSEISNTR